MLYIYDFIYFVLIILEKFVGWLFDIQEKKDKKNIGHFEIWLSLIMYHLNKFEKQNLIWLKAKKVYSEKWDAMVIWF